MSNDGQRTAEEVRGVGVDRQDLLGQGELGQAGQVASTEKRVGERVRTDGTVSG